MELPRSEQMAVSARTAGSRFGLLPEPERRPASFVTSAAINGVVLGLAIYAGMTAQQVIEQHRYEQTVLIYPTQPPAQKLKAPEPPRVVVRRVPELKLEAPKMHRPEPLPQMKPVEMRAKVEAPVIKSVHPTVVAAPQPKAALTAAAPAQAPQVKPSIAAVHLGDTFGVMPNGQATRPATVAALGNPYGGNGAVTAPPGVVGSTGIGNGMRSGANGGSGSGSDVRRVASAGIPGMTAVAPAVPAGTVQPATTNLQILSKPPVQYTQEARQLKIEGAVIVHVTFTAAGQVIVHGIVRGLGHGLDEEAQRVAQQIRFRPATRNGQPMDMTTNVTITFQMA